MAEEIKEASPERDEVDLLLEGFDNCTLENDLEEHPFKIKDKKTGQLTSYILRQLTSQARGSYINFQAQSQKLTGGAVTGMQNVDRLETLLVALSVLSADGKKVPEAVVCTWNGSLVNRLYKIAARINGFDAKGMERQQDRAKNS